jgi:methionyl-tRNA synthetase
MGKTLGNAVKPLDLAQIYGTEAFRYFLLRDMTPGLDADFDEDRLSARYHSDLANTLGNLLHRVSNMTARYFGGRLPESGAQTEVDTALIEQAAALPERVSDRLDALAVSEALAQIMDLLTTTNGYLERTAPWKEAKAGNLERVGTILYTAAEVLRIAGVLLWPVIPQQSGELFSRLGWQVQESLTSTWQWGLLRPGSAVTVGEPLFPRVEQVVRE